MYIYNLNRLIGRLCNNLLQISEAIYWAKNENTAFEMNLDHSIIKPFIIKFNNSNTITKKIYDKGLGNSKITLNERREILLNYILPNCVLPPLPPIKCLIIHMRGGDILSQNRRVNQFYVQPPLSFYRRVIEDCPVKNIIILTEDIPNPCAKLIAEEYDNCRIQSSNLIDDVASFLQATHVCFNAAGLFGKLLCLMSPNVEVAYIPRYKVSKDDWNLNFEVKQYVLSDTYIQPGEWNASNEQISQMIES